MKGAAVLLIGIFLLLGAAPMPADTSWNLGYDYTTGSGGYASDFFYGGLKYYAERKFVLNGSAGIFHDVNYDIVGYFFAQGRKRVFGGMWLGGILTLADGELSGADSSSASRTLGVLYWQELGAVTAKLEYEHTNGSIHTAYSRQVINGMKNRMHQTGGGTTALNLLTDTAIIKFDIDLSDVTDGLSAAPEVSFSNSSDKTKLVTKTLSLSYLIGKKIYLSADYAYASDNFENKNNYLTFGIYTFF